MIACFLSNISAKYYKNPSMLSRVIAKNVGDVFFETQCSRLLSPLVRFWRATRWPFGENLVTPKSMVI